jgi:hypothetical protein
LNNEENTSKDIPISETKPNSESNIVGLNEVPKIKPQKPKISFKEQWEKVDELCSHCGNVSKRAEGINRQNMKRLFSLKMNFNDIMTFLLVAMLLLSVYRYINDTAECKTFLESGSQNTWNELIKSGISIEGLIANSKLKGQYNPLTLSNDLRNASNSSLTGVL